jgi:hypothetical protein
MIRPRILESSTERGAAKAVSKPAVKPVPAAKKQTKAAFTMRHLWRMTVWGGTAAGALFVAVLVSRSQIGTERIAGLFSGRSDRTQLAARPLDAQVEERRLAEERRLTDAVRGLAAQNDELKSRLAAVERNVDDITGSVARQIEAIKKTDPSPVQDRSPPAAAAPESRAVLASPPAAAPPESHPVLAAPPLVASAPAPQSHAVITARPPLPLAPPVASAPAPPAAVPAQTAAPAQTATAEPLQSRTAMPAPAAAPASAAAPALAPTATLKYGVEIGDAVSIEVLRAHWLGIHSAHSKLFEGLKPVVMLRGMSHAGRVELRLVVGPLASAEAAAKLCTALVPYRLPCQPTLFSGQHIALQ